MHKVYNFIIFLRTCINLFKLFKGMIYIRCYSSVVSACLFVALEQWQKVVSYAWRNIYQQLMRHQSINKLYMYFIIIEVGRVSEILAQRIIRRVCKKVTPRACFMKYPKSVKSVFFFIGVLHYKLRARKTVHDGVVNEHFFFRCGSISATEFFP